MSLVISKLIDVFGHVNHNATRARAYAGHLNDGSGVQAHSAGGCYPYIVFQRATTAFDLGHAWCVMGPGIAGELRFASYAAACGAAERCKAVSENADAWAFELEALCMVAHQRQTAMVGAAIAMHPLHFDDMSHTQRVASLLKLGEIRGTLRLPLVQIPLFAAYAAAHHFA